MCVYCRSEYCRVICIKYRDQLFTKSAHTSKNSFCAFWGDIYSENCIVQASRAYIWLEEIGKMLKNSWRTGKWRTFFFEKLDKVRSHAEIGFTRKNQISGVWAAQILTLKSFGIDSNGTISTTFFKLWHTFVTVGTYFSYKDTFRIFY